MLTPEQNKLVMQWDESKKKLDVIKKQEKALRDQVFSTLFENKKGTQTLELGNGYKFKCAISEKSTISPDALALVLPEIEKRGADAKAFANLAIRYKPELDARGFKACPQEIKDILEEALVTKLQAPSLTIVEPKLGESAELDQQILDNAIQNAK